MGDESRNRLPLRAAELLFIPVAFKLKKKKILLWGRGYLIFDLAI